MTAHFPDFASFEQLAQGMNLVPVYRRLVSDTLTPVSAFCRLEDGPNSFLFESDVFRLSLATSSRSRERPNGRHSLVHADHDLGR